MTNKNKYAWPQASLSRSLWQFFSSLFLFYFGFYLLYLSLAFPYWVTLLLAVPVSLLRVRLFILYHDCGHGSFTKSKPLNKILGRILAVIAVTPYYYWKEQHAIHHRISGNLDYRNVAGDIWLMTTEEYQQQPWSTKIVYRIYRNPLFLFGFLIPFYMIILARFNLAKFFFAKKEENKAFYLKLRHSVYFTNIAMLIYLLFFSALMGVENFLLIEIPVVVLGAAVGGWLFYVQHQYEGTQWEEKNNWDFETLAIKGSSFYKLPKILQWCSASIGYHHVHHLNPLVPNYFLESCHNTHPLLMHTEPVTLLQSLKAARLKLWDKEKHVMVGFETVLAPRSDLKPTDLDAPLG